MKNAAILTILTMLGLLIPCSLLGRDDCYGIGGLQLNRYIVQNGKIQGDGKIMAAVGYLCPVLTGQVFSLDIGGSVGAVMDSAIFQGESTSLGLNIGLDYDGLVTGGLAPHWVIGQSPNSWEGYGVGAFISFRLESWLDGVANIFSGGVDDAFQKTPAKDLK